ncbi:MAG: cadherin-like domain-containing protein, partial [Thiomargarita sp.]|nr:cadherin-like domain-containing protein [Thiomargarita sp.]
FTYTITDADGDTRTATVTITVNGLPSAVNDNATTEYGTAVKIDIFDNDDQGDKPTLGTEVTQPADGTIVINPDDTVTYTPNDGFSGIDTFTYTITDADGDTSTTTVTIVVNPPLTTIEGQVLLEDEGIPFVNLELWTDPNGDGNPDDGELITLTTADSEGNYAFESLPDGNYLIVEQDSDNSISINLEDGNNSTNNDFIHVPEIVSQPDPIHQQGHTFISELRTITEAWQFGYKEPVIDSRALRVFNFGDSSDYPANQFIDPAVKDEMYRIYFDYSLSQVGNFEIIHNGVFVPLDRIINRDRAQVEHWEHTGGENRYSNFNSTSPLEEFWRNEGSKNNEDLEEEIKCEDDNESCLIGGNFAEQLSQADKFELERDELLSQLADLVEETV